MSDLYSTGRRVIFATNSTATAASYTAGFKTAPPADSFLMGGSPKGERYRGIRLSFYGLGEPVAANARVWALFPAMDSVGNCKGYEAQCLATITGSADAGLGEPTIPTGHAGTVDAYICDDLTVTTTTTATTPKGPGAILNSALGSAGAYAFAPNDGATPAFVIIPDCGNPSHIYVDGWDTNGAEFNGFIEGIV